MEKVIEQLRHILSPVCSLTSLIYIRSGEPSQYYTESEYVEIDKGKMKILQNKLSANTGRIKQQEKLVENIKTLIDEKKKEILNLQKGILESSDYTTIDSSDNSGPC